MMPTIGKVKRPELQKLKLPTTDSMGVSNSRRIAPGRGQVPLVGLLETLGSFPS